MCLPVDLTHDVELADAVLAAIERADLEERNLALEELVVEIPALADKFDSGTLKTILIATGCACAEDLVGTWLARCPEDDAPLCALAAAREWLAAPTQEQAASSAGVSRAALDSFARTRGIGCRPSWPAHAWFARSCAWLADAPLHGWQSVAALLGLMHAGLRARMLSELASRLGK
jgi:hypothetical protein